MIIGALAEGNDNLRTSLELPSVTKRTSYGSPKGPGPSGSCDTGQIYFRKCSLKTHLDKNCVHLCFLRINYQVCIRAVSTDKIFV